MNKGERLSILVMKLSLFATGNQDVKLKVQNMVIVLVGLSWVEQQIWYQYNCASLSHMLKLCKTYLRQKYCIC